ncbi:peptidoglycan-binding domain-containing protein [Poseidonocella sp. HB161398]|uniref:peptidoglycan-binding domain-containing protein n=1 Tax=Poseidonocella sp. HB161398 TaxID=2320855 RepID=UPI00110866C2|nr:peptidoglycan-binding domain-containing protein [Poseidonocella sp. HB161398]
MLKRKNLISLATAASLAAVPSYGVAGNDLAKALAGAAVAGAIFCGATGKCTRNKPAPTTTSRAAPKPSGISSAQRTENKSVQQALNGFGFNVGTPDGALGPKSRAGISSYQAYMGYNPTGYLDDYQRGVLIESYNRMNAGGGAAYPQVVASEGTKGLLKAFNDPNYPPRTTAVTAPVPPAVAPPVAPPPVAQAQAPQVQPTLPSVTQAAAKTLPALPALTPASASMSERCEVVQLMTQTNQGPILAASMTDRNQALSEQFCGARSVSITAGQSTADTYQLAPEAIAQSCTLVEETMAPVMAKLQTGAPADLAAEAKALSAKLAPDAETAAAFGKVCIGAGYREDAPETALSGALMMVGAGLGPYGELVGHHLREGFGTAQNEKQAELWYVEAMTALEQNQQPAFLPSSSGERMAVIRSALMLDSEEASNAGNGTLLPILVKQ